MTTTRRWRAPVAAFTILAVLALGLAGCQKRPGTTAECVGATASPFGAAPMAGSEEISCPTTHPATWNTGVPYGVSLTQHAGDFYTSYDGQVIDALLIQGTVHVDHDDVTIKRSAIQVDGAPGVVQFSGTPPTYSDPVTGLVIEDSDIDSTNPSGDAAVAFANYTVRRSVITGFGEGLAAFGGVTVEDSYIRVNAATCNHQDGIQVEFGDDVLIEGNTIEVINPGGYCGHGCVPDAGNFYCNVASNSAVWISAGEPHANVAIVDNLVHAVNSGTVIGAGCGWPPAYNSGTVVTGNRIVPDGREPAASITYSGCSPSPSGNVYDSGPDQGQSVVLA